METSKNWWTPHGIISETFIYWPRVAQFHLAKHNREWRPSIPKHIRPVHIYHGHVSHACVWVCVRDQHWMDGWKQRHRKSHNQTIIFRSISRFLFITHIDALRANTHTHKYTGPPQSQTKSIWCEHFTHNVFHRTETRAHFIRARAYDAHFVHVTYRHWYSVVRQLLLYFSFGPNANAFENRFN